MQGREHNCSSLDLAAEVLTFWNVPGDVEAKTHHYRKAGVPLLWWVSPNDHTVSVYRYGELAAVLGDGDTLDGEDVLPGFTIPVSEIFAKPGSFTIAA